MIRALAAALALWPALAPGAGARLALAVGSNDGGPERARLWYAERDAERFAGALVELGGFAPSEVLLLRSPDAGSLQRALADAGRRADRAAAAGERPLVVFYYSGHADPLGLRLGGERLPYADLVRLLAPGGGVRVAVVDACHAGALTQPKGAVPAPLDFDIGRAPAAEGFALIASASESEAAQESAALGGSFFTHHLTMGLRGAADGDGDGRVTLAEAYRYASHRTLQATARAGVPPQHPSYLMRLAGQDEVVLVDLRSARSALIFPAGRGRSWLVSSPSGEVVAEVDGAERPVRVALPAGAWRVDRLAPEPRAGGELTLPPEGAVAVDDDALSPLRAQRARPKGLGPGGRVFGELWVASPLWRNFGPSYGLAAGFRQEFPHWTLLGSVGFADKRVDEEGFAYRYRAVRLSAGGGWQVDLPAMGLILGGHLDASFAEQVLVTGRVNRDVVWSAGPLVAGVAPLAAGLAVRFGLEGSLHHFHLDGEPAWRGSFQLSTALEYGF